MKSKKMNQIHSGLPDELDGEKLIDMNKELTNTEGEVNSALNFKDDRRRKRNSALENISINNNEFDVKPKKDLLLEDIKHYCDFYKSVKSSIFKFNDEEKLSKIQSRSITQSSKFMTVVSPKNSKNHDDRNEMKQTFDKFEKFVLSVHQNAKTFIEKPILELKPTIANGKIVEIRTFALSPNFKNIAAGLKNGEVHVFELCSEKRAKERKIGLKDKSNNSNLPIHDICYSRDGKHILVGCSKGFVAILEDSDDEIVIQKLEKILEKDIKVVKYSPCEDRIYIGGEEGKLNSYKLNQNEFVKINTIIDHRDGVCAMAYSRAARKFASGGNDKILKIFQVDEGDNLDESSLILITKHSDIVRAITFSSNGAFILTGSYDKSAKLFDSDSGNLLMTYTGHEEPLFSVSLSPDMRYVLTGSQDNTAKLYDRVTGEILGEYKNFEMDIRCVQFFRTGSALITAGEDGVISFFSIREGRYIRNNTRSINNETPYVIWSVDISPDGDILATGNEDGTIRLYEIKTGFQIKNFNKQTGDIYCVKFSPDSNFLLSGGIDSILRIFDVNLSAFVNSINDHKEYINAIVFSLDGREFASGGADRNIYIYDFYTHERKYINSEKTFSLDFFVGSLVFSRKGKAIIAIGEYETKKFIGILLKDGSFSVENNRKIIPLDEQPGISMGVVNLLGDSRVVLNTESSIFIYHYTEEKLNLQLNQEKKFDIYPEADIFLKSIYCTTNQNTFQIYAKSFSETEVLIDCWTLHMEGDNIGRLDINNDTHLFVLNEPNSNPNTSLCMYPSIEPKYIAFGTDTGSAPIFDILANTEAPFRSFSEEVASLAIYEMGSTTAVSLKDGTLRVIDPISGIVKQEVKREKPLTCLKFIKWEEKQELLIGADETNLWFYSTVNGIEKIFNYDLNKKEFKLNYKITKIEYLIEDKLLHVICVIDDSRVEKHCFNILNGEIINVASGFDCQIKDTGNKSSILCVFPGFEKQLKVKKTCFSCIYVCYSDGSIYKHSFKNKKPNPRRVQNKLKGLLTCATCSSNFSKIIMGGNDKIVRVYEINRKKERFFKQHEEKITAVTFVSDDSYAVSSSRDGVVKIFEIDSSTLIFNYISQSPILQICSNNWIDSLIIGTKQGLVIIDRILNYRTKIDDFMKLCDNIISGKKIDMSKLLKNECFDMIPVYSDLSFLNIYLALSTSDDGSNSKVFLKRNKSRTKTMSDAFNNEIIGNKDQYLNNKITKNTDILRNIVEILYTANVSDKSKELLAQSIFRKERLLSISPWEVWMNLSLKSDSGDERRAILENLISILTFPNIDGVHKIPKKYKFLQEVSKEYPGHMKDVLDAFWSSPSKLTVKQYRMDTYLRFKYYLNKFYRIFINSNFKKKINIIFPMVLACSSPFESHRILEEKYESHCSKLDKFTDYDIGYIDCEMRISEISLDEIINLNENDSDKPISLSIFRNFRPEDNIFKSELLTVVVEYLWRLDIIIGVRFYRRMFLFVMLQLIICLNCLLFIPSREENLKDDCQTQWVDVTIGFDVLLIILFFWLLIYKTIKYREARINAEKNESSLFDSMWWIIDYIISIIGIATFSFDIHYAKEGFKYEDEHKRLLAIKSLMAITFALSWFRLIEFARGIKKTSALVRILQQVTNDMLIYLLIILFFIVGIAFTIFILQQTYGYVGPWFYLKTIYYVLLGDFGDYKDLEFSLDGDLYFILLFLTTVYLVIIMLNLLIAIVSNSFSNVISNQKQNEVYEKLKFIHDRIYNLDAKERDVLKSKLKKRYFFQLKNESQTEQEISQDISNRNKLETIHTNVLDAISKQNDLEKKIQDILDKEPSTTKFQKDLLDKINNLQESITKIQKKSTSDFPEAIELEKKSSKIQTDLVQNYNMKLNKIEELIKGIIDSPERKSREKE